MLAIDQPLQFGADTIGTTILRSCAPPEDGFVWSSGRWCEIEFELDLDRAARSSAAVEFAVDLDVFKFPPAFPGQNVMTYMNGLRVASTFVTGRTALTFPVKPGLLLPAGNILTFDTPDAVRPSEFGVEDDRVLGLQIFSVAITEG